MSKTAIEVITSVQRRPDTMRQSLDQLAANQQQMAGDIAKLLTTRGSSFKRFRRLFLQPLPTRTTCRRHRRADTARLT
jgi:hypothetical protein